MSSRLLPAMAVMAAFVLSGCESSADRATRYYDSGLALLEAGDLDRAAVEFRNVFRYDGAHEDARRRLAEIMVAQDNVSGAYGQYLRLAEQYPETADIRRRLAEIAINQGQWAEADRHGRRAVELEPEPLEARAIAVALDYRQAALDEDAEARATLAQTARDLLEEAPENMALRRVAIVHALDSDDPARALPDVEAALARDPGSLEFAMLKLQILANAGDDARTGAWIQEVYERFPENADVQRTLISWYLQQQDFDGAEAFLRRLAGDDTAAPEGHVAVVRLIETARGRDAALAELDRLIAANSGDPEADAADDGPEGGTDRAANATFYRSMQAAYRFEEGDADGAIAMLQDLVEGAEPSTETQRIRGMLAQMLLATDNRVGARALAEEILATDPANGVALKVRARMLIDADEPRAAIEDLRAALDQNPRDSETILLLADAHERDGSRELMGERLATAVEVSRSGARESLRYAAFLLEDGRTGPARSVLTDARAASPTDLDVLVQLARLALEDGSTRLVEEIIADLDRIEDPRAADTATSLRTALLLRRDDVDGGLALLAERAGEGDAEAVLAVVRTQVSAGRVDEARRYLDGLLADAPDDENLRLIDAALAASEGNVSRTEEILRDVIAGNPQATAPVRQLYGILTAQGRTPEATALLDRALAAQPEARMLQLFKAGELERGGDIPGAIAIYDALYTRNSDDIVVANNLASLLATHSQDDATLARAAAVARRLRGTDVAPFQDTYGWIAYRQGNLDEALAYLEPAAARLPDDPLVQYHLGMTYAGLDRDADAARTLERALDLAGDSALSQFDSARDTLSGLRADAAADPAADAAEDPAEDASEDPAEGPSQAPAENRDVQPEVTVRP